MGLQHKIIRVIKASTASLTQKPYLSAWKLRAYQCIGRGGGKYEKKIQNYPFTGSKNKGNSSFNIDLNNNYLGSVLAKDCPLTIFVTGFTESVSP